MSGPGWALAWVLMLGSWSSWSLLERPWAVRGVRLAGALCGSGPCRRTACCVYGSRSRWPSWEVMMRSYALVCGKKGAGDGAHALGSTR